MKRRRKIPPLLVTGQYIERRRTCIASEPHSSRRRPPCTVCEPLGNSRQAVRIAFNSLDEEVKTNALQQQKRRRRNREKAFSVETGQRKENKTKTLTKHPSLLEKDGCSSFGK